jgi:hypothetical protein
MLLLGFVSVLFHLKAATLASNISGASDGPGAAAAVVTGGLAAVAAVKSTTLKTAGTAANLAGKAGQWSHSRIWSHGKSAAGAARAAVSPAE